MRRSWLRRARRQSGWRRTATVAADRLVVPAPERQTAHLVPAETGSDGFAVETHVLARLLGVKLLTLEGVVLVSPAQVSQDGRHEPVARPIPLRQSAMRNPAPCRSGSLEAATTPQARHPSARLLGC